MSARIVIISGATGTGKTSISKILAEISSNDYAVHLHTDDFYQYIRKGYIAPWLNESGDQNETVMESVVASAKSFSSGGYEVFVDGVIGPWFLSPWKQLTKTGVDVRYIVLRPSKQETVKRATEREQRECFPLSTETVTKLWDSFSDLGQYESNAINTSFLTIEESVALIQEKLQQGSFRL